MKIKFSKLMEAKSYGVQFLIFEMLISHWSMLRFLLAVNPCDRAVNSFPKWYDTWKLAQKWGYESQISILVIFLSKPKKIKNLLLGGPNTKLVPIMNSRVQNWWFTCNLKSRVPNCLKSIYLQNITQSSSYIVMNCFRFHSCGY